MRLFDSHCHLEDEKFALDQAEVIQRMKENGVEKCVLAGSELPTSRKIADLCEQHKNFIYGVVGIHPHEASSWNDETENELGCLLHKPGVMGIGEIGLDYYYDYSPRDMQKEVLQNQLDLACKWNVPCVFHIRDAHGDFSELLRARRNRLPRAVLHCFSGSVEMAKEYLNMGFYLSFAGPVTFKNAAKLHEVARYVPLDRIMIETDSPYLAPVPLRGTRNEPANVRYVAELIADLRGMSPEEFALNTFRNTCAFYCLPFEGEVTC